jgi:hypothetical protein
MIKYIKNDFIRVRAALQYTFNRKIPLWIFIIYYVVVGTIALLPTFVLWMFIKIRFWLIMRRLEREA